MRLSAALLVSAVAALAQTSAPPPEVDQALRARVNEFFEYHVEGKFSKAYEMVAEDTKEYYFATQKIQFKSFKIDSVKFSDDFTQAVVDLTGQRLWKPRYDFPETVVTIAMHTTWKIENGKWVWYDHTRPTWLTPMGPSDTDRMRKAQGASGGMPDLSAEAMKARTDAALTSHSSLDKSEVVLSPDKPSTDQVVFHNGEPGGVKVYVEGGAPPVGLSADLDKNDISSGQDAIIKIHFDPKEGRTPPASIVIHVFMEPFHRDFPITVKFEAHPAR